MEIVGIGTEIVECLRIRRMIEKHADSFLRHAFTEAEIRSCHARRHTTESFAAIWAAKEAFLKSVGLAGRKGIAWIEIEIDRVTECTPEVSVAGGCAEWMRERRIDSILLTASYCRAYATATALAVRAAATAQT